MKGAWAPEDEKRSRQHPSPSLYVSVVIAFVGGCYALRIVYLHKAFSLYTNRYLAIFLASRERERERELCVSWCAWVWTASDRQHGDVLVLVSAIWTDSHIGQLIYRATYIDGLEFRAVDEIAIIRQHLKILKSVAFGILKNKQRVSRV